MFDTARDWLLTLGIAAAYTVLIWVVFMRDWSPWSLPVMALVIVGPIAVYPLLHRLHGHLWRRQHLPRPLPTDRPDLLP